MLDLHHLPGSSLQERYIRIFRKHMITLLPLFVATLLIMISPFAAYVGIELIHPDFFDIEWQYTLFMLGSSIFFLFSLLFIYQSFIDHWLDVLVVTERRILNIKQDGLFHRTVSELRMSRIQDVTSEMRGFWHTMLNYGIIHIQTAGETERFIFRNVGRPNDVAKLILEMTEIDRKSQTTDTPS